MNTKESTNNGRPMGPFEAVCKEGLGEGDVGKTGSKKKGKVKKVTRRLIIKKLRKDRIREEYKHELTEVIESKWETLYGGHNIMGSCTELGVTECGRD